MYMLINYCLIEGWPVLVPSRYAGENVQELIEGDIVGEYNLLHGGGNSEVFIESNVYTFLKDGSIKEKAVLGNLLPHII